MNDEAFARRFYADRAELDSLGIHLKVDKPAEGYYEAENYSLPPENFYLPAIEFTDEELGALRTALSLLDGEFAYAEPLRLALQQLSWGKPSPARRAGAGQRRAGGHRWRRRARAVAAPLEDRDGDLPPQDDPLRLLHDRPRRGGEAQGRPLPPALPRRAVLPDRLRARARRRARLPRVAHPRQGRLLVEGGARLQPARGLRPAHLRDPHGLAAGRHRAGAPASTCPTASTGSRCATSDTPARSRETDDGVVFETDYADSRQMVSWVLGLGEQARIEGPDELADEARERLELVIERHAQPTRARAAGARAGARGRPTTTTTATSRRSGPSASPGSSRWPAS